MASRNANALRRFCLVYFGVDQTTSIVETKKLRNKENGKLYSDSAPEKGFSVTVEHCRKMLDAMVISSDGKLFACLFFILRELLCNCTLKYFPFFFFHRIKTTDSFLSSHVDNKGKLRQEETLFIDDPANAHLFQEEQSRKRTREEAHSERNATKNKQENNGNEVLS